jgi:phosphoglycolate phosphatase
VTSPPTLVLDLDGTLVDTAADLVATLNVILAGEDIPPLAYPEAIRKIGNGAKVMLETGLAASGVEVSPMRLGTLYDAFLDYYEAHMADNSSVFPGAVEALDRFAAAGWRLAVCTNKLERLSKSLLADLGIGHRYAVNAGQDTYGVRKPDPRHMTETFRDAGGTAERAVMVGDSIIDVDTARAAKVRSVAVSFGYSPVAATDLGADRVIDHFDQLFATANGLHPALPSIIG